MQIEEWIMNSGVRVLQCVLIEDWQWVLTQLSAPELYTNELARLTVPHRKCEILTARYLLLQALGEQPVVEYTPEGKPLLVNNTHAISISHTKGQVAVAVHPTREVGIDIEQRGDRMERLKVRFLNEQELAALADDNDQIGAHLYWAAKEAIYKIVGRPAVDFRKSIYIHPFELNAEQPYFVGEVEGMGKRFDLEYRVMPERVLVVATEQMVGA